MIVLHVIDHHQSNLYFLIQGDVHLQNAGETVGRATCCRKPICAHGASGKAAKLLGISFRSMRYRLDKYEIDVDEIDDE